MYPWALPTGPYSAERTQKTVRNRFSAQELSCPCQGAAALWADSHPPACIPAKEARYPSEVLCPSPSHPQLVVVVVVVVQSGLDHNKTSQACLGRQVLLWCLPWQCWCVPQAAGHIWDESYGISSAMNGNLDNLL